MAAASPTSMLASTTHDTKRSEDVRARLLVLAEIPGDFAAAADRWHALAERHWGGVEADRNLEWLLFQTLVGAHPLPADRAWPFVEKAMREAKVHTSWLAPNAEYEDAAHAVVDGLLADDAFLDDLDAFVAPLVEPGWTNALAMQALKLTAPGVPDVYQGTELWDLSLVDPDNRRPVDYDERRRQLADGSHPKLRLTRAALHLRADGAYAPVTTDGEAKEHVIAFTRGERTATVVPRCPLTLARRGGFRTTTVELPSGDWTDAITGATVSGGAVAVATLLQAFPVAVLERDGRAGG